MRTRTRKTMSEVLTEANKYAVSVLKLVPFPSRGLSDDDADVLFKTIHCELAKAWLEGYSSDRR